MEHLGEKYQGMEYQMYFKLDNKITNEKDLKRIQIEVVFSGRTRELMGTDRMKKDLVLQKTEQNSKIYQVRVPSTYRTDYLEEELNYLISHIDEVQAFLFIDDKMIRGLY
jgi:azurin